MQVSNDWPSNDSSYEGWSSCVVVACEHSEDAFTCEICLEKQPSFKKKSKLQIVGFALLSPIYLSVSYTHLTLPTSVIL